MSYQIDYSDNESDSDNSNNSSNEELFKSKDRPLTPALLKTHEKRFEHDMTITHSEIKEPAHLHSSCVAKLSKNSIANPGTVSCNTQFMQEQPKMCIEKTQKLTKAKAKEKGKEYEVTEHETVRSLKMNAEPYATKIKDAIVDFQRKGFKERTIEISSATSLKIKLVAWNHFDDLGRSGNQRAT